MVSLRKRFQAMPVGGDANAPNCCDDDGVSSYVTTASSHRNNYHVRSSPITILVLVIFALGVGLQVWTDKDANTVNKNVADMHNKKTVRQDMTAPIAKVESSSMHAITSGRVLIDVTTYAEGISAWKEFSIPELIAFADAINGTLVEPCMRNGRLYSCLEAKVPVSEVLNLSSAMHPPSGQVPRIISRDKYFKLLNSSSITLRQSVCMTEYMRTLEKRCPTSKLPHEIPLDKFREDILNPSLADYSILHIEDYWKKGTGNCLLYWV